MTDFNDTVCAPATVPGTGAITLIRVSGRDAFRCADAIVKFKHSDAASSGGSRAKFGVIYSGDDSGSVLDEVICCIYRAPHSYTGEDSVEIMCHASSYICSEILQMLCQRGCRLAQPGEFTQRAFINGKMDLAQAEAVADVISSSTAAAHHIAMKQLKGGFSAELSSLRASLLEMASLLELELDFSEEDVEFADRSRLSELLDTVISKISALSESFKMGNAIKNGVPVAIVGAPNSGKSTLLNAILGENRAIVSDIAGTTRDTIEETINLGGILFRFVDTAGIRSGSNDIIEKIGIERSFESIRKAQIVIVVLDSVTLTDTLGDLNDLRVVPTSEFTSMLETIDFTSQKVYFALNKCDIAENLSDNIFVNIINYIVSYIKNQHIDDDGHLILPDFEKISAKTCDGIEKLLASISNYEKNAISGVGTDSVLITNLRHFETLVTARKSLLEVRSGLASSLPTDLIAEDLRSALSTLGTITGEITSQDVLNNIFRKFCIGK